MTVAACLAEMVAPSLVGKVGIVSDAHGNAAALEKALRVLRRSGAQHIFCLGDSVGYIPGTRAFALIAAQGIPSLKGNHEAMTTGEITYSHPAEATYRLMATRATLDEEMLALMSALPRQRKFSTLSGTILMCHASPDDLLQAYVYPDTPLRSIRRTDFDIVFMGHTHRPFIRDYAGRRFINVGSCGQPRDRGDLGSACLFDEREGSVEILRFNIRSETEAAIAAAGLGGTYVAELLKRRSSEPLIGTIVDE